MLLSFRQVNKKYSALKDGWTKMETVSLILYSLSKRMYVLPIFHYDEQKNGCGLTKQVAVH